MYFFIFMFYLIHLFSHYCIDIMLININCCFFFLFSSTIFHHTMEIVNTFTILVSGWGLMISTILSGAWSEADPFQSPYQDPGKCACWAVKWKSLMVLLSTSKNSLLFLLCVKFWGIMKAIKYDNSAPPSRLNLCVRVCACVSVCVCVFSLWCI